MIRSLVRSLAIILFLAASPAMAQFADQATYAGTGGGTANAQTLTLPNASSYADLVGVIIKYFPTATNTGGATLNVNSFGSSPSFRKPSGSGVSALSGGEIVSGQPTYVMYDGTYFNIVAPTALPVSAASLGSSALTFGVPVNLSISTTVGSNQLTIALKGADGNDPSATNPVLIPFRDVTIANSGPTVISLQSALSFTVNSTNTMGCVSAQMCRLWIVGINDGGTVGVCAFNALSGTNVAPINEAALQSSASGTTGGSSAQTYYCNISAVTSKAIRILGYVDITETVAGTWASGPTYVQLFGPGIKKPGDVVQVQNTFLGTGITDNTQLPVDNTIPQNTEGWQVMTVSITPTSAANVLNIQSQVFGSGATKNAATALFRDSTANAITAVNVLAGDVDAGVVLPMTTSVIAGSTVATTFKVRFGMSAAGTSTVNGTSSGSQTFGGVANTFITVKEIMSSLTPANDDVLGAALPKVG